jgi:phage host-nuclease inhibitor protein Gam
MTDIIPINENEKKRFQECEIVIKTGINTFIEVGKALLEIRDNKYYRENYDTFEDYCQEKWQIGKAYAYRYISAFEITNNLSPMGDILPLPENERQIRALSTLSPDDQRQVWQLVYEMSQLLNKPITASMVKQEVEKFQKKMTVDDIYKFIKDLPLNEQKQIQDWYKKQLESGITSVNVGELEKQIKQVSELKKEVQLLENKVSHEKTQAELYKSKLNKLQGEINSTNDRLKELEDYKAKDSELKEKEEKIKKTITQLHELEKKKAKLFSDSQNLEKVMSVYVRSRDFFQKEVFYIAGLEVNPGTKAAMKEEITQLIEMVENWKQAITNKFLSE